MSYFTHARAKISRHFLRALITVECMGKGAKTGRTKKPGYSVCIFLQETDLYITVYTAYLYGVAIFYVMMIFTM